MTTGMESFHHGTVSRQHIELKLPLTASAWSSSLVPIIHFNTFIMYEIDSKSRVQQKLGWTIMCALILMRKS